MTPSARRSRPRSPLLCFSHLRWDFVLQRPQHLMSRFNAVYDVTFWEEPLAPEEGVPVGLELRACARTGVTIATPRLPEAVQGDAREASVRDLLDGYVKTLTGELVTWYYTPMMLPFSRHLESRSLVYDCMDELANFKFAPPELLGLEAELLARADVVFTGGYSLYEAKQERHRNIHPFPSSVDRAHFEQARGGVIEPGDQAGLQGPILGFYGVVDERMDLGLLDAIARERPQWQLVIVGPVVKIDEAELPRRPNIHYLGGKTYAELPAYLAGWDVALMPFAINESTRFISPTKTPEYLAGGKPVVSTPITDVIRHYGDLQGVKIADSPQAFIAACDQALALDPHGPWLTEVDRMLAELSWDRTFRDMDNLIAAAGSRQADVPQSLGSTLTAPAVMPSSRRKPFDYLVVGAGFAGSVLAERLAAGSNKKVLVVDRRPHIGGNAYDHKDAAGVLIHKYGPHIFHTNSQDIADYLGQFTKWRPYEHRVLASARDKLLPIPINRTTLNELYGLSLKDEAEAEAFLKSRAEPTDQIRTSEDVVVAAVGRELYELFFQGYTRKQWGIDPSGLDKAVTARIPTRTGTDDRYFGDKHQIMPRDGYTAMFNRMLDHPNIDLLLSTGYAEVMDEIEAGHIVYTGPVDEYFGYRFGKLPYRSLRFEHRNLELERFQPVAVVNYPDPQLPYTRITEYKHLTGQDHPSTSISYEYPSADGDPYYPIPRPENQALYKKYEALADANPNVTFVGRLATYRYYNMDQVVGQALAAFRKLERRRRTQAAAPPAIWTEAAE
ncbi:MAG TPA: UDP-galactopyranose mutase [Caulobacter sp.]|nr:UDP-galactopyranose mutase [Caulobacter sp.]